MSKQASVRFFFCFLTLSLACAPAMAGKARLVTDTSAGEPTVPFVNAAPADDNTQATGLGGQVNGTEYLHLTATGTVGVGTTDPKATKEINGDLKIGTKGQDCDASHAGLIQWTGDCFQGCTGTSWVSFACK